MKKSSTARMIVAGSNDAADLKYACGFSPVDPVVFLDAGAGNRHLVVPLLEFARACAEAPSTKVWTPISLGLPVDKRRSRVYWALEASRRAGVQSVRVGPQFPVDVAFALKDAGIDIEVVSGPLYPERETKSPHEIEQIAKVQRAAVTAMRAAIAAIRRAEIGRKNVLVLDGRPLTSERLKRIIATTLLDHDCSARDPIVACGPHAADPHHRGEGPLRAGQTIVLDIFPQHQRSGYWGDITRTVVKGKAPPKVRAMYRAVREAQAWAVRSLKPGVRADRIHAEILRRFEAAGFPLKADSNPPTGFIHGTGHGVGLEIHEPPSISTVKTHLRSGHVVTVEPGLYDPELGGVRIEDTVVIQSDGAKILASYPYPFELP